MKRLTIILLLISATTAVAAPAKKAARWKSVRVKTTCEAVAPGSCIGEYGFTVDPSGYFVAGPSPAGLRVEGQLSADESNGLQRAVRFAILQGQNAETCIASHNIPGSTERLTLTTTNGHERIIYRREAPAQLCYRGDKDTATHLHDVMQRLMAEHYPQHFPQLCRINSESRSDLECGGHAAALGAKSSGRAVPWAPHSRSLRDPPRAARRPNI